jgi:hypothetical protein
LKCRGFIIVGAILHHYHTIQVGYSEQALCYILLVKRQPIIIPVCVDLRIFEYSGGYSIILYGESSKCIYFKSVSGIILNYHPDKLVAGNNHLITYLGQRILFSTHSVEI